MAEAHLRQSPLAHLELAARAVADRGAAGVALREIPYRTMVTLRGDAGDAAFASIVTELLGTALPTEPMTAATAGEVSILWMGPDEWLVIVPPGRREHLPATLSHALEGVAAAATEVGESMTVIGLSGPHAREVLAKGCTLDLHPRVFGPGKCARTLLAKTGVALHQTDAGPDFEIYVHRSFADYAWRWLEDAGGEYGVAVLGV